MVEEEEEEEEEEEGEALFCGQRKRESRLLPSVGNCNGFLFLVFFSSPPGFLHLPYP